MIHFCLLFIAGFVKVEALSLTEEVVADGESGGVNQGLETGFRIMKVPSDIFDGNMSLADALGQEAPFGIKDNLLPPGAFNRGG